MGNNPNTVYKAFKTLKVFINRAIEQEIIEKNPVLELRFDLLKVKCNI